MNRILVVDDEENILRVIKGVLEHQGYEAVCVKSGEEAVKKLKSDSFDVMITDFRLGRGMDGLDLIHQARLLDSSLTVIMVTGYGTIDVAVQTMKEGAFDFITKPFKLKELAATIDNALEHRRAGGEALMTASGDLTLHFGAMVGECDPMQEVYRMITRVAKTDATVLIQGESGTGKELVAKAIHDCSDRSKGPYIPLNCAALSPSLLESELFGHVAGAFTGATRSRDGLFLAAHGGSIFLDEIESMNMGIQSKLLRVLQEKNVRRVGDNKHADIDVRVIAATNEDLEVKRDAGEFREDLFYRISVIPINLPPLRRRMRDIPLLTKHFCTYQSRALGHEITIGEEVLNAFMVYGWPGNVRELQNAIACAAALCDDGRITIDDLPPHVRVKITAELVSSSNQAELDRGESLQDFLRTKEKEYLEHVLEKVKGNRAKAAELLGISRATLYRKLPDADEQ